MKQTHLCVACSVQVLYELLKRDPEVAQIPDDKGHIALELAVDRSYDQPSPALDVVVQMLSNPHQAGQLSGNGRGPGPQRNWRNTGTVTGAGLFVCWLLP